MKEKFHELKFSLRKLNSLIVQMSRILTEQQCLKYLNFIFLCIHSKLHIAR